MHYRCIVGSIRLIPKKDIQEQFMFKNNIQDR